MTRTAAHLLLAVALTLLIAPAALAEPLKAGQIRTWLSGLADADPDGRDRAWQGLAGLKRGDLDVLRAVVAESMPLLPGQAVALPEIVMHVFLSEEPYAARPESGFLGIRMGSGGTLSGTQNDGQMDDFGVVVLQRHAGFVGYRMLRDGDIIVGVAEHPQRPVRRPDDLGSIIRDQHRAGQSIRLQVLRRGQMIEVPVTLNAYPAVEQQLDFEAHQARRGRRAQEYWQQWFAPLVQERIS